MDVGTPAAEIPSAGLPARDSNDYWRVAGRRNFETLSAGFHLISNGRVEASRIIEKAEFSAASDSHSSRGCTSDSHVVVLPHAQHRLSMDDPHRVGRFAQRFAWARCLAMDDGAALTFNQGGWTVSAETRQLHVDGHVGEVSG